MIVSEAARREMHSRLVDVLGRDVADLLMEHLPPSGWGDVATKQDLELLRVELRGEIAELRGEFRELRGEFTGLRGEFTGLRGDLRSEFAAQTRTLVFSVAGMCLATVGTVAALVH